MDTIAPLFSTPARPLVAGADKLKLFISYSRDDLDFADQLCAALEIFGYDCTIDRHGISAGEEWQRRLGNLIAEADTVVFVLSPSSARSEMCAWEVAEATKLAKRILPITCRALDGASPPARLANLNYIYFYHEEKSPDSGFGKGLAGLITALNTDLDWLREHTRYLQRAREWDMGGRPANRLLSGADIAESKSWAARRPANAPELTPLQLDFIKASEGEADAQLSVQRQQLAEREELLGRAETALKQAADEQRRRAQLRAFAFASVSTVALVAIGLGLWAVKEKDEAQIQRLEAETQRKEAQSQKQEAERGREAALGVIGDATTIIIKYEDQFDAATNKKAFSIFRRGAELGNMAAMYNAGFSLSRGQGVERDVTKACDWYEASANKGLDVAMNNLASCFDSGNGRPKNQALALDWFRKAAAKGYMLAELTVAQRTADTVTTEQGKATIAALIEKAKASKDTDVLKKLGDIHGKGSLVPVDYAAALKYYRAAADGGHAYALTELASYYEKGRGLPAKDPVAARKYYQIAADKGNDTGLYNLARFYETGLGGEKNIETAIKLNRAAAAKGNTDAMNHLGYGYDVGLFGKKDAKAALEWYGKAAAAGNGTAMDNLGLSYEFGMDGAIDKNIATAREWYQKAADTGTTSGMIHLGAISESTDKNIPKAREWYEKAAKEGNAKAVDALDRLAISELVAQQDFNKAKTMRLARAERYEALAAGGTATVQETPPTADKVAGEFLSAAWYALLARDFTTALSVSERAHKIAPAILAVETNRAHALMFLERKDEARKVYFAHRGELMGGAGSKTWEAEIANDYKEFHSFKVEHPMMVEIERELGISH